MNKTRNRNSVIRTLVVDDAPAAVRAIRTYLESTEDAEVAGTARTGKEAIEMARRLQPDLLLLDLFMPGLSGLEVVKGVRAVSPHTCIIIITVLGEDMKGTCRDLGADGFLVKN